MAAALDVSIAGERRSGGRRAVRGGVLGNYVDQFDIMLPVAALTPVADQVFGSGHALAAAGWVFVATLLGRPLGAMVFGPIADRVGRTAATRVALAGIALTTALIAVVPGHTVLGGGTVAAVVALRFLGGVFVGGEYSAAIPLAMEWSRPRARGALSGLVMAMSPWANATVSAIVLLLSTALPDAAYASWGWRVPFAVGAALAAGLALYYRALVPDSEAWQQAAGQGAGQAVSTTRRPSPLRAVLFGTHRRALWQVFMLMSGLWLLTQMAVPTLMAELRAGGRFGAPELSATLLVATVVSAVAMQAAGHLSTRTGRRRFFVGFAVVVVVAAPVAWLGVFAADGLPAVVTLAAVLQVVTVTGYAPVAAYLAERFPASVRASGYGVGYSLSLVVPALYPLWLPAVQGVVGHTAAIVSVLVLGGLLLGAAAWWGPEPDVDAPLQ